MPNRTTGRRSISATCSSGFREVDTEIADDVERIKTLIEQLETGEISISDGEEIFQVGQDRLAKLRELVVDRDGEIKELE
ncbi:hypothetical protein [Halorubrum pallidum]|uniref:Uncharacterized protein n=1 Tax=Halorubrum pallidum TaxID=1526114 RepID=A0ABD5SYR8_9EURY